MEIAIDAHSIGTQAGGNETYFRQLLRGLARDPSPNHYTIFQVTDEAEKEIGGDSRFEFVRIPKNAPARLLFSIPRELRRRKPDAFHCQYVQPRGVETPTVVTIHDLAYEHHPEFFPALEVARMKRMVRATAQRAQHVATVSKFCAEDIVRRYGIAPEKISFAYQAPAERFRPRDKESAREHLARTYGISFQFILYVGRLQARKNLLRLVEAYARLRKQGADVKLVIAGKRDWQFERLDARVRELGLEDAVHFPGYVGDDDLPLFYNAAETFVFPSIFEGFGLPVVESMASGAATVTSYGSSLEEVAGDGALLVDPLNVDSITEGLARVLEDTEFRRQLIERGLRRSAQFKADELPKQLLGVYRELGGRG